MKSRLLVAIGMVSLVLVSCTGENKPIQNHDNAKMVSLQTGPSDDPAVNPIVALNSIQDETERIQKSEQFLLNDFSGLDLKVKFSNEAQVMISFLVKKWAAAGSVEAFNKVVDAFLSENEMDDRVLEGLKIVDTKNLILKSAETAKDPVFRFKLVLLMNRIQEVGTTDADLLFIQNQLSIIKKETQFKFAQSSAPWIKANRDLIERLLASNLDSKVTIDSNEFAGANITRSQRENLLASFVRLKKNVSQVLSPTAVKEISEYRNNIKKLKTELPYLSSKIKLTEITDDTELGVFVSLLISDIDPNRMAELVKSGVISPASFKTTLEKWIDYEIAQIVAKYRDELAQFQKRRVNFQSKNYFPEMRKSLAASQILSRERSEKLRIFLPATQVLKLDTLRKRIVDLDIFLKRFLTSNTVLIVLKMYGENGVDLKEEIRLNNQVIKKESSASLRQSNVIPNVLMVSEGFYLGEMADQFEFSTNDRMLQKFEVMDGLEDGIKLGLFKELGYDEQDLLKNLFLLLAQSRLVQLEIIKAGQGQEAKVFKLHENLKIKMRSTQWEQFQSYCSSWKANQTVQRDFDLEDVRKSLLVGKLSQNIENNSTTLESGGSNGVLGLWPYTNEITKSLEFLRTDVSYVVLYMDTLMDALSEAGLAKDKLANEISNFKSFYTLFLKDYLNVSTNFDECYHLKRKKEQELVIKVIQYERKYWEYVLSKVTNEKNLLVSNIAPLSYALPTGIKSRSYFSGGSLSLVQLDFYFRIKQYMEHGLNYGSIQLPPIDPSLKISLSADMATQKFYRIDPISQVKTVSLTTANKIESIMSAHEFNGSTFVDWFAPSNLGVAKYIDQLDTLYSLYRFGPSLKESFGIDSSVTLEHVTKTYHNNIFLYHINDELKSVMDTLNLKERAGRYDMTLNKFILKENELAIPFYDHILMAMGREFIGYYGSDDNFTGGGDSRSIRRPMQLLSTEYILKSMYRYFDESYVSIYRNQKMPFGRYLKRMTQEMDVLKKIVEYVEYVEKSKNEKEITLRIRTIQEITVPWYSPSAKDNVDAAVTDMKRKTDVILSKTSR